MHMCIYADAVNNEESTNEGLIVMNTKVELHAI